MIVRCPFCSIEHEHNDDMVKGYPNTVYICLTQDCGLKYVISLDEDFGSTIKTMCDITEYWAEDGSPLYYKPGDMRFPRKRRNR